MRARRPLPLLLLLAFAACRSAAPPQVPTDPLPAPTSPNRPDPGVEQARLMEEEIERPVTVGLDEAAREQRYPRTLEIEFAAGAAALDGASRALLDALAQRLRTDGAGEPLELLATSEDGSGSADEQRLQRRRLEAVREHLLRAGVARGDILMLNAAALDGGESMLVAGQRLRRVFVIVRAD